MVKTYDIDPPEFEMVERRDTEDGGLQYFLIPNWEVSACPCCGSERILRNGYKIRNARDLTEHGKPVGLSIRQRKFRCKNCESIWTDEFKTIGDNEKMTKRMKEYLQTQSLRRPFTSLAEEQHISDATVRRVFLEKVEELNEARELHAPKILGIDENHLLNQYRAVFTDIENGLVIEMLPTRSKQAVVKFLRSLPGKEEIAVITQDMWRQYRDAVAEVLPNVPVVIDKFHVVKEVNLALDSIRVSMRKGMTKPARVSLKNNRWLLLSNAEDLSFERQKALLDLFDAYPQFEEPYRLKERFRDIYRANTRDEAERAYEEWRTDASKFPAFASVIATVENWREEIFAYFDHRYTNALTESLNRLINEIGDRGRGYSCEVLRAKVLYGTKATKPAKYKYSDNHPFRSKASGFYVITAPKREVVHGQGADIKLLLEAVEDGEFDM